MSLEERTQPPGVISEASVSDPERSCHEEEVKQKTRKQSRRVDVLSITVSSGYLLNYYGTGPLMQLVSPCLHFQPRTVSLYVARPPGDVVSPVGPGGSAGSTGGGEVNFPQGPGL